MQQEQCMRITLNRDRSQPMCYFESFFMDLYYPHFYVNRKMTFLTFRHSPRAFFHPMRYNIAGNNLQ